MGYKRKNIRYIPGLKSYKGSNNTLVPKIDVKALYSYKSNKNKMTNKINLSSSNTFKFKNYGFIRNLKFKSLSRMINKIKYTINSLFNGRFNSPIITIPTNKRNTIQLIIGIILILFGIISIIKNTVVYTPMYFMNSLNGGVSFASSAFLLLLGIFLITYNKKKFLGLILICVGFLVIAFSVFTSLRLGFMQTSLLKTIFIFGAIVVGIALILRYITKR